jgi:hypothetical protein
MTDSTESLLTRAQAFIDYYQGPEGDDSRAALARDLRNRVVELEANQCTNPLRSELTCEMLVRDWELCRERVTELEAQQSSLREKIEALRSEFDLHRSKGFIELRRAPMGRFLDADEVLALLSDAETP